MLGASPNYQQRFQTREWAERKHTERDADQREKDSWNSEAKKWKQKAEEAESALEATKAALDAAKDQHGLEQAVRRELAQLRLAHADAVKKANGLEKELRNVNLELSNARLGPKSNPLRPIPRPNNARPSSNDSSEVATLKKELAESKDAQVELVESNAKHERECVRLQDVIDGLKFAVANREGQLRTDVDAPSNGDQASSVGDLASSVGGEKSIKASKKRKDEEEGVKDKREVAEEQNGNPSSSTLGGPVGRPDKKILEMAGPSQDPSTANDQQKENPVLRECFPFGKPLSPKTRNNIIQKMEEFLKRDLGIWEKQGRSWMENDKGNRWQDCLRNVRRNLIWLLEIWTDTKYGCRLFNNDKPRVERFQHLAKGFRAFDYGLKERAHPWVEDVLRIAETIENTAPAPVPARNDAMEC